jgi:RNA polymerase sigma-70 factor (ECF subfamily)
MSVEEQQLVDRIRAKDVGALAEYLTAYRAPLLAFIARQLGNGLRRKIEPEDLLQEVSAEAVRCLPEADLSDREPFSWLCQIAQRRTIDAHRRFFGAKKRDAGREVPLSNSENDSRRGDLIGMLFATMTTASKAFSRNQREIRLLQALSSLPEEQRQALHLRYMEGLPTKEIADRLGKSNVAVRVMLSRSLDRLQQVMGPDEAP